jgi:hypothetical protein
METGMAKLMAPTKTLRMATRAPTKILLMEEEYLDLCEEKG